LEWSEFDRNGRNLVGLVGSARNVWGRVKYCPGGLIDEATVGEKKLAWMPMRQQPQLKLLGHNALAMFFRNDTEAFMAKMFTEKEDYTFLHKMA